MEFNFDMNQHDAWNPLGCCLTVGAFASPKGEAEQSFSQMFSQLKEQLATLYEIGFDFVELPMGMLTRLSEEEFLQVSEYLKKSPIRVPVYNSFIPPHIRLVGPEAEPNTIEAYVKLATERVRKSNGKIIVFGSGPSRTIPAGYPMDIARRQIERFLGTCEKYANLNKLQIALEPLNRGVSNVLNTVRSAFAMAEQMNFPHIMVMADSYQMDLEEESFSAIEDAKTRLIHVHVSDKERYFPGERQDGVDFAALFDALRGADYKGRISLECNITDLKQQGIQALEKLKEYQRA